MGRACLCPALGDRKGRPYIYILSCMPSPPFPRLPVGRQARLVATPVCADSLRIGMKYPD